MEGERPITVAIHGGEEPETPVKEEVLLYSPRREA